MMHATHRSAHFLVILLAALALTLVGCKSILPVRSVPVEDQAPLFLAPTFQPANASISVTPETAASVSTQTTNCTNLLQFIAPDVTYPDGSEVTPGQAIDKQWKVKNSGTCNWDSAYTLQLTGGDSLSAATTQALVPARNGTETIISIQFTAPLEPGTYRSEWKAFDPNGQSFGDLLYMVIIVTE